MSKKEETKFKEKVQRDLKQIPKSHWTKIQQIGLRGTPDIIGCINGKFVAIELKRTRREVVSALQSYELECYQKAGGVSITTNPEAWEYHLKLLLRLV